MFYHYHNNNIQVTEDEYLLLIIVRHIANAACATISHNTEYRIGTQEFGVENNSSFSLYRNRDPTIMQ